MRLKTLTDAAYASAEGWVTEQRKGDELVEPKPSHAETCKWRHEEGALAEGSGDGERASAAAGKPQVLGGQWWWGGSKSRGVMEGSSTVCCDVYP